MNQYFIIIFMISICYFYDVYIQGKIITRQRKAWHPLARGGGKIDLNLFPFIIHNLHVKFESD